MDPQRHGRGALHAGHGLAARTRSAARPCCTPSSQWLSDPALSVRLAYDGATTTSWIADPRDADPTLTVDFDRPQTHRPASRWRHPHRLPIATHGGDHRPRGGRRARSSSASSGSSSPWSPSHLSITFANPTRGVAPIGISELYLPPATVADAAERRRRRRVRCAGSARCSTSTDAGTRRPCAGSSATSSPRGRCDSSPAPDPSASRAGTHRFRLLVTEQFQPVTTLLRSAAERLRRAPAGASSTPRGPVTRQTMTVGPGAESMLSTTRNLNRGWQATLDGKRLDPMVSDGWAQAWRVPAGEGGRVEITYAPQRPYLISLYGGLVRGRPRPARPRPCCWSAPACGRPVLCRSLSRPAPTVGRWLIGTRPGPTRSLGPRRAAGAGRRLGWRRCRPAGSASAGHGRRCGCLLRGVRGGGVRAPGRPAAAARRLRLPRRRRVRARVDGAPAEAGQARRRDDGAMSRRVEAYHVGPPPRRPPSAAVVLGPILARPRLRAAR